MEKDKKTLSFSVDAGDIDIKQFLKKDFLELSIKAISTANPNRNNSWFTRESMEKSKGTFANKPILGYFENDDFVSHDGKWTHDEETGMDYWNTLGRQGERILGVIRDNDPIEIIEDNKGLSWIKVSCVLWVEYNFKQVKRLLKDAKKAKQKGGLAKNVSVEVDITDWEELPNGVMKINEFNLVGITILGSRNGIKIEPGIEDAGLSVIDIMGRDVFEKQAKAVRLAYEKLNDNAAQEKKEDFSAMEENKETVLEAEEGKIEEKKESFEENSQNAPEEKEHLEENSPEEAKREQECDICEEDGDPCLEESADGEPIMAAEEEDPEDPEEDPESCPCESEESTESEEKKEECITSSSEDCSIKTTQNEDESTEDEDDEDGEDEEECKCEHCAEMDKRYADLESEYCDLKEKYNTLCEEYDSCKSQLEARADYEGLKQKVESYEHQEFLEKASKMIESGNLDEETSKKLFESCDKGDISTMEDLKVKVALEAFESGNDKDDSANEGSSLSMSIYNPAMGVNGEKEKKKTKKGTWEVLNDYAGK